jgi:glucokinase
VQSNRSSRKQIVGIDVGGTKIAACLIDLHGRILSTVRRPTDVTTPEATLDSIAGAAIELMHVNLLDSNSVNAIGFGIPGIVDAERGIGIASVNLGWKNVAVRAGLESRLGIRCVIDNDVRVGALGEAYFGVAKGLKNLVYLNIGTGISAVILINGKFFMGSRGLAGEIGHAVLVSDGPVCKCGGRGCFEAVASGPGIAQRALEKIKAGRESMLAAQALENAQPLTAEKVFDAATHGDPVAIETLSEIGTLMAYSLEYLALAYDPDIIVLGGSVVLGSSLLFQIIQQKLQELADSSWVFGKAYSKNLVQLSTLGNNAGVLGAAALVAPHLLIKPQIFSDTLEGGDLREKNI